MSRAHNFHSPLYCLLKSPRANTRTAFMVSRGNVNVLVYIGRMQSILYFKVLIEDRAATHTYVNVSQGT